MEFDFTTPDQKTAQQQGIRWVPDEATPEQIKEWHDTEGKWWADRALSIVAICSFLKLIVTMHDSGTGRFKILQNNFALLTGMFVRFLFLLIISIDFSDAAIVAGGKPVVYIKLLALL